MPGNLSVSCQSPEFAALWPRTRSWPPTLRRHLRTQLHASVRDLSVDLKAAARALQLQAATPARYPQRRRSTGLRRGIANSVRVVQRQAGDGVEFRIRANHPMAQATNATRFRHPVHGHRERPWVTQMSQPWWSTTVPKHNGQHTAAAEQALRDALGDL